MRYGSVCSGIEAATAAWHPLGWEPAFFSEIEKFPRAVLEHHYPEVPLHGDFTTIGENDYGAIDLLVGGTPCQSFSTAGLRKGMADERGNLALEYLRLAQRKRPTWLVWENVPGVLSSNGGRDFGSFLGGLGELGYGFAYRVLDAQYFGVPQRRRRVFVVGYLGDWRPAAAVLFERHSLQGHPAPRREAGEESAPRAGGSIEISTGDTAHCLNAGGMGRQDFETETLATIQSPAVALPVKGSHWDGTECHPSLNQSHNTGGIGASNQEIFSQRGGGLVPGAALPINTQIATRGEKMGEGTGFGIGDDGDPAFTLQAAHSHGVAQGVFHHQMAVRRFTPVEAERLQGFPDNFTRIPYRNKPADKCPDGPRYKALGNSMAVPVMAWIGQRIQGVETLLEKNDD